jgi:tetratricopeptide (TPR) repeat protein
MVLNFRHSQPRRTFVSQPEPTDVSDVARHAASCAGAGRTAEALRYYQLALLTDEERPDIWFHYGVLQRRLGQVADAIESFEFALRLDPSMYTARCNLALARSEVGQPLEALDQLMIVTRERPNYLPAWHHVVQLVWALGNHDEALRLAEQGLGHARGDADLTSLRERIAKDRDELPTEL